MTHRIAVTFTLSDEDWARVQAMGECQHCDPATYFRSTMRGKAAEVLLDLYRTWREPPWRRNPNAKTDRTHLWAAQTIEGAKAEYRKAGYRL